MAHRFRYFVWRGIEGIDDQVGQLIEISQKYEREQTWVTDDFAIVFLTEREIRAVFPSFEDGQILIPGKLAGKAAGSEGFKQPGQFLLGIDAPISLAEYSGNSSVQPGRPTFDRLQAERLIDADAARRFSACGKGIVNVVIVDGGLDEAYLKSIGYSGTVEPIPGLTSARTRPHVAESQRHANAVARSVLSIAPHARLVDAPILPERIGNVDLYASRVIELVIRLWFMMAGRRDEAWVVVCAWGLMDRRFDRGLGSYADDRRHMLSVVLDFLVSTGVDVVFSAGNSGTFAPDVSSGHTDRGPFHSIIGANGLSSVLTVGGVDPVGQWIGGSSQGPEPVGMRDPGRRNEPRKPDVCAPTWFREHDDRNAALTGTSGACAVAAGVVAAIRKTVSPADLSPEALIDTIRKTARREGYTGGSERVTPAELRLGSGIIDCAALTNAL